MTASPRVARIRRALAISSAAVVVATAAAACDSASADTGDGYYGAGQTADGHPHGHGSTVVPLSRSTPDDAADPTEPDEPNPPPDEPAQPAAEPVDKAEPVEKKDDPDEGDGKKEEKKKKNDDAPPALDIIGTDCDESDLDRHDGFQKAPRCVQTSFGEVSAADQNPSLLITDAPRTVKAGEGFALVVSTRNLKRDRFLGAAVGGYYAEASFLDDDGIQRGHFHTACRMLESLDEAPDAAPDPAFFLATQDNQGGAGEDKATVDVTGLTEPGTAQCAVWAGDGSHRVPMMERANQTPAFDVVRITVE